MTRLLASVLMGAACLVPGMAAAEAVCVTNTFEVAWVHPGIYFYANQDEYRCEGPSVRVKQGETGCFAADLVTAGNRYFLAGEHAVSGECVSICETARAENTVIFDLAHTYACAE